MTPHNIIFFLILVALPLSAIQHPTGFITLDECIEQGASVAYLFEEENDSKQFVLSLKNGVVVGEGGIVTANGKILTDTEFYERDQQRLMNGTRDITTESPLYFDGTLMVLSSPGQQCYYHWMLQLLPRLKILQESQLSYDKIYLNVQNVKFRWQRESLYNVMDHLGIPRDKLLCIENNVVEAKKLLVTSIAWKPSSSGFWKMRLEWYEKFFTDVFVKPNKSETSKYIFISRSKAHYRRISNEASLMALLNKKGFVAFNFEDLGITEQAVLFHNAEIIIGPHGAGWTNLIFCKPGTCIIEIDHGLKSVKQRSGYKKMAKHMGCKYHAFYTDLLEDTEHPEDILAPINQDLMVDVAAFEQFFQSIQSS